MTEEAKRTTCWIYPIDDRAIERIRARWGLSSDSDAVRLALRVLAATRGVQLEPAPGDGEARLFTLWRFPADVEAIEILSRGGELSDADVIRGAIRYLSKSELVAISSTTGGKQNG
jgi:Arc/MetJ-type ribon-helix-helix transcriptional regulator